MIRSLRERTGGGGYVHFTGFGEEKDALTRVAYGPGHERLRQAKATYDSESRFRVNQNTEPAENGQAPA